MFRLIFSVYLLLFFRFAQGDVLVYFQQIVLGNNVAPLPWVSALLLTFLLTIVGRVGEQLLKKYTSHHRLAYVFTGWLATATTSLSFVGIVYQMLLLVFAIVVGVLFVCIEHSNRIAIQKRKNRFWYHFYPTAMQMLLLCFYVGAGNGVKDIDHYELQMAQALQSAHPKRGYKVGEKSYATSHRLFAMRCYLLATTHKKGIGDKLFDQMVPTQGNSETLLLPVDAKQQLLFSVENQNRLLGSVRRSNETALQYLRRCAWLSAFSKGNKRTPAIDYYLSALLLDRKLDDFAREVVRYYPHEVRQGKLPTYFAQAFVLYQRTRTQPVALYNDSSVEANYQDYSDMGDSIPNRTMRNNMLRYTYGETYWWWYTYGK